MVLNNLNDTNQRACLECKLAQPIDYVQIGVFVLNPITFIHKMINTLGSEYKKFGLVRLTLADLSVRRLVERSHSLGQGHICRTFLDATTALIYIKRLKNNIQPTCTQMISFSLKNLVI